MRIKSGLSDSVPLYHGTITLCTSVPVIVFMTWHKYRACDRALHVCRFVNECKG